MNNIININDIINNMSYIIDRAQHNAAKHSCLSNSMNLVTTYCGKTRLFVFRGKLINNMSHLSLIHIEQKRKRKMCLMSVLYSLIFLDVFSSIDMQYYFKQIDRCLLLLVLRSLSLGVNRPLQWNVL